MAQPSKINWTQMTWNPIVGCTKVSPGCKNCYAERQHVRCDAQWEGRAKKGTQQANPTGGRNDAR